MGHIWGHHLERLMRALLVVEGDPVINHLSSVNLTLETMSVHALLLQCSDHSLHDDVPLRVVWRDQLPPQATTVHQPRIVATGEHQAVVKSQREGGGCPPQYSVAGDEGLLQFGRGATGLPSNAATAR